MVSYICFNFSCKKTTLSRENPNSLKLVKTSWLSRHPTLKLDEKHSVQPFSNKVFALICQETFCRRFWSNLNVTLKPAEILPGLWILLKWYIWEQLFKKFTCLITKQKGCLVLYFWNSDLEENSYTFRSFSSNKKGNFRIYFK